MSRSDVDAQPGDLALISAIGANLGETLRRVVPSSTPVALLDFPRYRNVGDAAIWLGQRRLLGQLGATVGYTCDRLTFSAEALRRSLPGGTVLLSGGGSFGDLWPEHQRFRERVIAAFPDKRIVQLPQSVVFRDERNLDRARSVFNAHPDLTLMWRDTHSLEFARDHFDASSMLCPDMASALGALQRPTGPRPTSCGWVEATSSPRCGRLRMSGSSSSTGSWAGPA